MKDDSYISSDGDHLLAPCFGIVPLGVYLYPLNTIKKEIYTIWLFYQNMLSWEKTLPHLDLSQER